MDKELTPGDIAPNNKELIAMTGKAMMTNAVFANQDTVFIKACENAGIKPTKRQASRYRAGRGLAYSHRARGK